MQLNDFQVMVPNSEQLEDIQNFGIRYQELAEIILDEVKPSGHRTAALRLLLESKMTLIHGITHPIPF